MKKFESMRIALYNENFKAKNILFEEVVEVEIRGTKSSFNIKCGNLDWEEKSLEKTYVLEIHYKESEDTHRKKLPIGGFNSYLYSDYAMTAHKLAEGFCKDNGLKLVNHLNSWPEFQAILQSDTVVSFSN